MIMAISCVTLIMALAMEVMYDSTVEYTVNSQALNRLKAYYAARSGMEISLLRIKIYQTVKGQMSANNPMMQQIGPMLDLIWKFPFAWPLPAPDALNSVDKDTFGKLAGESMMDAAYACDIRDEGSKLDLNDLISPSKTLRETTKKRLIQIFEQRLEEDEEFKKKYGNARFEDDVVNPIADWMSDKNTGISGGDKRQNYGELNRDREYYPPNRGFRTLDELRMVAGMNEDFFEILAPRVTIFGMRGVNPNVANKETLKSLDPGITDEVVTKIMSRRDDPERGPFRDAGDFWNFVQTDAAARLTSQDPKKEIPLSFETLTSFRVKVTGEYGGAIREIEAVVFDVEKTAEKIKSFVDKDKQAANPQAGTSGTPGATGTPKAAAPAQKANSPSKGPPRIVYWSER